MKTAYISTYRDDTPMGKSALSHILACEEAGCDVVCRPISLSQKAPTQHCVVEHLETEDLNNVDIVVQHVFPNLFEHKSSTKNIGCFSFEANNFRRSSWARCCNLMDEIWVPSNDCRNACLSSHVNVPTYVIPYSQPKNKFVNAPTSLNLPQLKDKCVFYTIGEVNRQNNLSALLRSYYAAFSARDNVILVIYAGESTNALKDAIIDIKKSTHIYTYQESYPPIMVITHKLSDEQINQLHINCDVFVSPARGVGWGIEAYDAIGFGNPVILSEWGSFVDLVDENWSIHGQLSPCLGTTDGATDLYTGADLWFDPNLEYFIWTLQEVYKIYQTKNFDFARQTYQHKAFDIHDKKVQKIGERLNAIDSRNNVKECQSSVK